MPLIAKLFVKVPDTKVWLTNPPPAGFLRWEGPTVLPTDPMIRVDLISSTSNGPAEPREAIAATAWRVSSLSHKKLASCFCLTSLPDLGKVAAMGESKFSAVLIFFLVNYFVTFLIIGLIAAGLSLINKPKPLRIDEVGEALLSYYLLFPIGINNLINFVFHVFFGDISAKFIGWENSPFQAEVGFASLGVGIAGVIAFKASLPFRFATLIPPSAFALGAAGGHIYQMIVAQNFSPGNVGLVLPSDILIPDCRLRVFVAVI